MKTLPAPAAALFTFALLLPLMAAVRPASAQTRTATPAKSPTTATPRPAPVPIVVPAARTVSFTQPGEGVLHVTLRAPGCLWDKTGAESAVATISLDNAYNTDIVVYNGAWRHTFDVFLGPVTAGKHQIAVVFDPKLSPQGAKGILINNCWAESVTRQNPAYEALAHAPLLYGRPENATSATPLIAFYERELLPEGKTRLVYSFVWSRENGDSIPDYGALLSQWGRTTGSAWVVNETLRPDGTIESATIPLRAHSTTPYTGARRGLHPVLQSPTVLSTANNNGTRPLLFALAPLRAVDPRTEPREAVMDSAPWTYRIAAREMTRLGALEATGNPAAPAPSDARNYLYVDAQTDTGIGMLLAVEARLKDGRRFVSDHGRSSDAIGRSGWWRTAIELPPGTTAEQVAGLAFVRRDAGSGGAGAATARVNTVRAFFLDGNYLPATPFLRWHGDVAVPVSGDSFLVAAVP